MASENGGTVGTYVTLQRGKTYNGMLVGVPGPALLGLGSIEPGGGFREGHYKTYGGECPRNLMLYPGDIYVSLKGATKDGSMIGSVARVPPTVQSGRLTQDTVKLEFCDPSPVLKQHIYWVLRTPQYRAYCDGRATGSAQVGLSREDFLAYPIPPITAVTKKLGDILEAIEGKIELNRRMSETLEAMAKATFKSWFVDFDPVRAKLDGRKPKGMDVATAKLFPDGFEESGLGAIPKGWRWGRLDEIAFLQRGFDITKKQQRLGRVPVVSSSGCASYHDTAMVKGPGVVLGRKGVLGSVFYIEEDYWPHDTTLWVKDFRGHDPHFVYYFFRDMARECALLDVGSANPTLNRNHVHGLQVPVPPRNLTCRFGAMVAPLFHNCQANLHQTRTLCYVRDTLLSRLLSGEINIDNAEKVLR